MTGKLRGSAYQDCNLNLIPSRKLYDSRVTFQEVGKYSLKISVPSKTIALILDFY